MNIKQKIGATLVVGSVIFAAVDYVRVTRVERAKRAEIKANLAKDIAAIERAHARVIARINRGEYDGALHNLFPDMKFEIIAAHYE